jgi:hypothetical protein
MGEGQKPGGASGATIGGGGVERMSPDFRQDINDNKEWSETDIADLKNAWCLAGRDGTISVPQRHCLRSYSQGKRTWFDLAVGRYAPQAEGEQGR